MPGPPGELVITKKIISREGHQKLQTYGHVAKLFLESDSTTKEINKQENANSQQNLAVFLAATDSENISIQIIHRKGQIKKLDRVVIVRTGIYL